MRFALGLLVALALADAPAWSSEAFPRPKEMEPQIRFWRSVFTEYSRHQFLLHDTIDLNKVYKVLDFRRHASILGPGELQRLREAEVARELRGLREMLVRFHEGGPPVTAEERRIHELFRADRSPTKFLDATAADRLRTQQGIKERYAQGFLASRRYIPAMERILRAEGVPIELARLPFIESSFNLEAYSKVGAAGVWQFMPATGRRFLTVGSLVDERRDPLRSTRAAARFLRENHRRLGTWPLAITAYNHGPAGIARAVEGVGSRDIMTIVKYHRGASFGFSSRNFYAEFLAALEVDRDAAKYFPKTRYDELPPSRSVRLTEPLPFEDAARIARSTRAQLVELNPALMPAVTSGRRDIPAGYALRLAPEGARGFERRSAALSRARRVARAEAARRTPTPQASASRTRTHRVRRGQTLTAIAREYGVSLESLRSANGLSAREAVIRPGQTLQIPNS